jgi:hypothetical protein
MAHRYESDIEHAFKHFSMLLCAGAMHLETRLMSGMDPPLHPSCLHQVEEAVVVASVARGMTECAPLHEPSTMHELAIARSLGESL